MKQLDEIYGLRAGGPHLAPWPTKPCRVVFLDFDGVMNSEHSIHHLGTPFRFARECVSALNQVLRQSGALIVITSTWRNNWTLRENAEFLERDGVLPDRVLGKTPSSGQGRGTDIDAWLNSAPFDVDSFVILDDRDDFALHRERLIRVSPLVGFSFTHVQHAIELLSISRR